MDIAGTKPRRGESLGPMTSPGYNRRPGIGWAGKEDGGGSGNGPGPRRGGFDKPGGAEAGTMAKANYIYHQTAGAPIKAWTYTKGP